MAEWSRHFETEEAGDHYYKMFQAFYKESKKSVE